MKSAAEFMGGINNWQDFYFLTPGLSTSGVIQGFLAVTLVVLEVPEWRAGSAGCGC